MVKVGRNTPASHENVCDRSCPPPSCLNSCTNDVLCSQNAVCWLPLQFHHSFTILKLVVLSGHGVYSQTTVTWAPRSIRIICYRICGPGRGSQKATLVVLRVVVVISSLKIPKAFLICNGAERNFAYIFLLTFPIDLASQIFHLFSN